MAKRRIMRAFKIAEISGVTDPCQEPARAVIIKRAELDYESYAKRKYTAEQRRQGAKEGWAKADGSYPIKDRGDLKNAISSWGRGGATASDKAWIMRRAKALGASDMLPPDWTKKSADTAIIDAIMAKIAGGATDFNTMFAEVQAAEMAREMQEQLQSMWCALDRSIYSIREDESMSADAKLAAMRGSVMQFVSTLRQQAPDLGAQVEKAFAGDAGDHPSDPGEDTMPDDSKKVADLEKTVADLTKRAETAETIAKFSGQEREHYDGLDDAGKTAFMAKDANARARDIADKLAKNEVVYKSTDGTEYRKSDDPRLVQMAKDRDADAKRTSDLIEKAELSSFEKRAENELGSLPGEPLVKAKALRSISKLGKDDREAIETMLKAGEASMQMQMSELGSSHHRPGDGSAQAELDKLAADYAKENKVDANEAMVKVLESPRGAQLYAKSVSEKAASLPRTN